MYQCVYVQFVLGLVHMKKKVAYSKRIGLHFTHRNNVIGHENGAFVKLRPG